MKKPAILIDTDDSGKIAIVVPNFSKDEVIKALAANCAIKADDIEQLSASMSYGLYAFKKEHTPDQWTSNLVREKDYEDTKHFIFRVDYIIVIS
jgi:hypothetical protein